MQSPRTLFRRAGFRLAAAALVVLPADARVDPILNEQERLKAALQNQTSDPGQSTGGSENSQTESLSAEEYIRLLVEMEARLQIQRLEAEQAEMLAAKARAEAEAKAASMQQSLGSQASIVEQADDFRTVAAEASDMYQLQWIGRSVDQQPEAKVFVRQGSGGFTRTVRKGMRLGRFVVTDIDPEGIVLKDELERLFKLRF